MALHFLDFLVLEAQGTNAHNAEAADAVGQIVQTPGDVKTLYDRYLREWAAPDRDPDGSFRALLARIRRLQDALLNGT